MAFCPNCGTPNTDHAEKCVACGTGLAVKQKAKFKGTIMMTGVTAASPAPAPSPAEPEPPPAAELAESGSSVRNPRYAQTVVGVPAVDAPPTRSAHPEPEPPLAVPTPVAPEREPRRTSENPASTLRGITSRFPHDEPAPARDLSAPLRNLGDTFPPMRTSDADAPAYRRSAADLHGAGALPPSARRNAGPGKIMLLGCAGALAVTCIVAGLLYYALAPKIKTLLSGGRDAEAQAAAWHAQLTQALTQVAELCKTDCQKADVFFHPVKQIALLPEATALNPARVQRLGDASAKAEMLDATDDGTIASELALDPQQCVRVVQGSAKVISCSVPEASGRTGVLRIVHLSGVGSL